jgi:prepilin-type processing-associated H-X9-DG protein
MNNYINYCNQGNRNETGTMFKCPSQTCTYANTGVGTKPNPISYGMGWFLGGSPTYNSTNAANAWLKITRLPVISESMLVMEHGNMYADAWMWNTYTIGYGFFGLNGGLHAKGLNVLYSDGHVGYKNMKDIPTSNTSADGRRFWQGIK